MPTTGNQNQDTANSEEPMSQNDALECPLTEMAASGMSSDVAGVVSSTTMDSDFTASGDVAIDDPDPDSNKAIQSEHCVESSSDTFQDAPQTIEFAEQVAPGTIEFAELYAPHNVKVDAEQDAPQTVEVDAEQDAPQTVEFDAEQEAPENVKVDAEQDAPQTECDAEQEAPENVEVDAEQDAPQTVEVDAEQDAPQTVEFDAEQEAPENVEFDAEQEAPENIEVDAEQYVSQAVELDTEQDAHQTVEFDAEQDAPQDHEFSTIQDAPQNVEFDAEQDAPQDHEFSTIQDAPQNVEFEAEQDAPQNVEFNTEAPESNEFSAVQDAPQTVEFVEQEAPQNVEFDTEQETSQNVEFNTEQEKAPQNVNFDAEQEVTETVELSSNLELQTDDSPESSPIQSSSAGDDYDHSLNSNMTCSEHINPEVVPANDDYMEQQSIDYIPDVCESANELPADTGTGVISSECVESSADCAVVTNTDELISTNIDGSPGIGGADTEESQPPVCAESEVHLSDLAVEQTSEVVSQNDSYMEEEMETDDPSVVPSNGIDSDKVSSDTTLSGVPNGSSNVDVDMVETGNSAEELVEGSREPTTIAGSSEDNDTIPTLGADPDLNVTPSGTTLVTNLFDDFGHPPQDNIVPAQKQYNSLPHPTNSFQSAFAAFASATSSNVAESRTPMEADKSVNETKQSENVVSTDVPKAHETKKISVLEMPTGIGLHGSNTDLDAVAATGVVSKPPVMDVGFDSTQVVEENPSEQPPQNQVVQSEAASSELSSEGTVGSDAVYFIQMTDPSGEIVTSIIDPNDIASYSDSIVYKQCMGADGQIETTIVNSGGMPLQEQEAQQQMETAEPQPEMEHQVIYAHDLNGQLTPIDSVQSANDVAPPGKQFVYMQDSSGRIIRTIMDANQTMVPGQQVYYTQSEDGRIITSVMDSESTEDNSQQYQSQDAQIDQQSQQVIQQQELTNEDNAVAAVTQQSSTSGFAIDNSMSGLSMLAELSHLTAGQGSVDLKGASNTESSNSQDADMDEFRPVAMITRGTTEEGVDTVNSDLANLKVAQSSEGSNESMLAKLTSEILASPTLGPVSVSQDNLFVQWQNLDAMCWMDVVLIMLVYSPSLQPLVNIDSSHELASTLLITLLKANRQAQVLLQNLLKRSSRPEANSLQNGAGNATSGIQDAKTSKLVCKENMDEIGKAINILYAMREQIWRALQPRLRCERGKHNSPVLVLPLLVREKPIIKQMFTMTFRYVFKCDKCGYSQDDSHSKILPTIPAVPANFNMKDPCFVRNCFECQAPDQRMFMKFEGLQDFVQIHFVKGLPHSRFEELSFDHNNDHYEVTAVVHYKNNPDHFIAWVRNAPGNTWMECDDLKSVITRYQNVKPCIPPSQVHMVMWERRLTPQHTLVMRDTEDTKLLSSLVLTVQQPAGSQTTTPDAAAAKPPATTVSSLSTPSTAQGSASSSLLGLISQSQSQSTNFSPYTPRARGRGVRGTRGTRGTRGGNSVTIRRGVSSLNTQMISPVVTTPRQQGTPQIIRLPLSALQGMGAQIRGSSGTSPSRFILVGGNSNTQPPQSTSSNTQSKVVVVRSQGGTTPLNQLSATQLLQLLQRHGAISNASTRITTTISRASSDGTTQQQTITLTPENPGGLLSAPTSTETDKTESVLQAVNNTTATEPAETPSETPMDVDSSVGDGQIPATSSVISQGEEALQMPSTTAMSSAEEVSEATTDPAPVTSLVSIPSAATPESNAQSKVSTVSINSGAIRTLSRAGLTEGNSFVQIPNPKGGPNIMTQLVVRGDKMVLVPVDKSSQPQSSPVSSPIVRMSTASSAISDSSQTSSTFNPTEVSSSLTSSLPTATMSTSSSSQTTRYITIPAGQGQGGKRTIQLISIPRGSASSVASPGPTKTFIVGPSGTHTASRIISQSQGDEASPQQSSNIIVREVKRPEDCSSSTATTAPVLSLSGEGGMQTPSSAISLLRDMSVKSMGSSTLEDKTQGISILSPSAIQASNKAQETFKYILPGSNTQQMGSLQTMSGAQMSSKVFTALSSSGTIIGGQLTPVSTDTPDTTPSPVESVDTGVQSIYPELESISPTVVTSGRGRGRGRGGRGGRGRVAKTQRGRGGRQQQLINQNTYIQMQNKVLGRSGTISMLPADFRQVGGQIIETSLESVDGAPVVSIPDFSNVVTTMQADSLVTSESGLISSNPDPLSQSVESVSSSSPLHTTLTTQESTPDPTAGQGPRVITQTIPSIKANHGFDILTQGILGNAGTQPTVTTPRKTGISLLTGKAVTSPPATNLLSSSHFSSDVTRMQQSLAMGHSVSQNEIETLIKAAQGAAKPPKPGQSAISNVTSGVPSIQQTDTDESQAAAQDQRFNVDDFLSAASKSEDKSEIIDKVENKMDTVVTESGDTHEIEDLKSVKYSNTTETTPVSNLQEEMEGVAEKQKRVFSVDESQVSAAERYRMPTELFQPDEESPEKPVRNDGLSRQLSSSNVLGEDLPAKLFHDSEISSQDDEIAKSPDQRLISPGHKRTKSVEMDVTNELSTNVQEELVEEKIDDISADESNQKNVEVSENIRESVSAALPSKRGRKKRGRKPGPNKGGVRRKSSSTNYSFSGSDFEETVEGLNLSPQQSSLDKKIVEIISSPKREMSLAMERSPEHKTSPMPIGGFANDILRETEEREKVGKDQHSEENIDKGIANGEEGKEGGENEMEVEEQVEQKFDESLIEEKKEDKENLSPAKCRSPRSDSLSEAHVVYKKPKIDWSKEVVEKPSVVFNYKSLTRAWKQSSNRHASLGPRMTSYTSAPAPLATSREKLELQEPLTYIVKRTQPKALELDVQEPLTCIVKRTQPKALERPKVDPSKEPTVIPLVPEEDADPACTCGGSVVTSHQEGEVFTGVVVRQRKEIADWNTVTFEEEGDSEKWEDKESLKEFIETMWTAMCMEIGFSDFFDASDDNDEDDDEDGGSEEEDNNGDASVNEFKEEENAIESSEGVENCSGVVESETVSSTHTDGKRKLNDEISACVEDSKRMRPSVEEESSIVSDTSTCKTSSPPDDTTTPGSVCSPSRFNGISKPESVVSTLPFNQSNVSTTSSSTLLSSSSSSSSSSKKCDVSSPAFISPARRSSRTPVPSLKIRDSLEEIPMKLLSKGRRSSLVSSDDDMSGYSSDEVAIKKKVKTFHVPQS